MKKYSAIVLAVALLISIQPVASQTILKIGTRTTKGSSAAKILDTWGKGLEANTSGRLKVQFSFLGVQGNERDIVNKMKAGQFDGGLVSSEGLRLIAKTLCVLELPCLFKSQKEIDLIRTKMAADFNVIMDTAGYMLLGWTDPGWTHIFANAAINSRAELAQVKMWIPASDPGIRALWSKLGANGTPLGVPDVLPSLQTGLINGCMGTYEAGVSMQWYTKVKYAVSSPLAYTIGACIILKSAVAGLNEEDRNQLSTSGAAMAGQLSLSFRSDNDRAGKAMEKAGVKIAPFSPAMITEMAKEAQSTWESQANSLYAFELLKKILSAVSEKQ